MSTEPSPSPPRRLVAIDLMRGLVMVLMTVDHASEAFNAGRLFTDSARMWKPGTALPIDQFLTRWVTHLCAPTFVFLAGAALALTVARRTAAGERDGAIDRYIVTRGLFIAALDPLWMSLAFMRGQRILLQVLYAIGTSLVCMALLRRLPGRLLVAGGLALIVGVDVIVGGALDAARAAPGRDVANPLPLGLLVSGGFYGWLIVGYPLASWLGIMMLGWAFGRHLAARPAQPPTAGLALGGALSLVLFAVLRGLDGFGNMGLHRDGDALVQWLHVSKYPPSVAFCALELGLMALALAAFFHLTRAGATPALVRPLRVLGENALFFYLLHVHLLLAASYALGAHRRHGLVATWFAAACTVAVLHAACVAWGRYKASHKNLLTRFV